MSFYFMVKVEYPFSVIFSVRNFRKISRKCRLHDQRERRKGLHGNFSAGTIHVARSCGQEYHNRMFLFLVIKICRFFKLAEFFMNTAQSTSQNIWNPMQFGDKSMAEKSKVRQKGRDKASISFFPTTCFSCFDFG